MADWHEEYKVNTVGPEELAASCLYKQWWKYLDNIVCKAIKSLQQRLGCACESFSIILSHCWCLHCQLMKLPNEKTQQVNCIVSNGVCDQMIRFFAMLYLSFSYCVDKDIRPIDIAACLYKHKPVVDKYPYFRDLVPCVNDTILEVFELLDFKLCINICVLEECLKAPINIDSNDCFCGLYELCQSHSIQDSTKALSIPDEISDLSSVGEESDFGSEENTPAMLKSGGMLAAQKDEPTFTLSKELENLNNYFESPYEEFFEGPKRLNSLLIADSFFDSCTGADVATEGSTSCTVSFSDMFNKDASVQLNSNVVLESLLDDDFDLSDWV